MTPNLTDFYLEVEYNVDAPEERLNGDILIETVVSFEGTLVNKTCLFRTLGVMNILCNKQHSDGSEGNSVCMWLLLYAGKETSSSPCVSWFLSTYQI